MAASRASALCDAESIASSSDGSVYLVASKVREVERLLSCSSGSRVTECFSI